MVIVPKVQVSGSSSSVDHALSPCLVDNSDNTNSLGILHAIPGIWCPGGGGRGTVWKSEGGWGG